MNEKRENSTPSKLQMIVCRLLFHSMYRQESTHFSCSKQRTFQLEYGGVKAICNVHVVHYDELCELFPESKCIFIVAFITMASVHRHTSMTSGVLVCRSQM